MYNTIFIRPRSSLKAVEEEIALYMDIEKKLKGLGADIRRIKI